MSRFNSKEDLEHNILVLDEYPLADPRKSIAAFPDALSDDQPDTDSTYTAADSAQESYFDPNYDSNSILGAHHNSLPSSDLIRDPEDDSPVSRGALRRRQLRRPRHACVDDSRVGPRRVLGHHPPRHEPVLLFPIPIRRYRRCMSPQLASCVRRTDL